MRLYSFRAGCLLLFGCVASVAWIKRVPSDGGSTGRPDLQTLYQRLVVAEELGGQVSRDLSSILVQLRNISKTANITHPTLNTTTSTTSTISTETTRLQTDNSGRQTFLLPNIYLFMPHLRQHPGSLLPRVVLGQGRRGVSMVLGIPTVKREKQSYLVSTINSLLYSLTPLQQQDLLIIVFVAETDSDYVGSIAETIRRKYLFRSGNIETSGDKFNNTTVEVLPSNAAAGDRLVASSSSYKESDNGFIIIGAFEDGKAEGEVEEVLQPISALRLVVHSDADVWALLSEILIKV